MANAKLSAAKEAKNDEFYTQLSDIRAELSNYSDKFQGKVVFCNCDDPFESNFVKYFLMNFNRLGLKELIATGYKTSPIVGNEIGTKGVPYAFRVSDTSKYLVGTQTDLDNCGAKYFLDAEGSRLMTPLVGNPAVDENGKQIQVGVKIPVLDENGAPVLDKKDKPKFKTMKRDLYYEAGDFRSDMSIELLKQSDIVCTNPPFSLFREFVVQLMKYQKQFLIIGNMNAITYKEFFPLLKDNLVWGGYGFNKVYRFQLPNAYEVYESIENGKKIGCVPAITWFTNIDHAKRHQILPLDLGYTYEGHEDMYPKYDNYDAINVDKVSQIPCDYMGVMGVPISFLDKYCPEQFEIVSISMAGCNEDSINLQKDYSKHLGYKPNGVKTGRTGSTFGACPTLLKNDGKTVYYTDGKTTVQATYCRVFIRFTDIYVAAHPEQFAKDSEKCKNSA